MTVLSRKSPLHATLAKDWGRKKILEKYLFILFGTVLNIIFAAKESEFI